MKILLVDDTLTERMIMSSYLKKMGHEIVTGENGEQAVTLFQTERPDLVLLDVIMPVMDGYEAARRIRALRDEWIPIIFLSARSEPEDIAEGIKAGGDDYLTKPADRIVVVSKMNAMQRIAAMRRRLLKVSDELKQANRELQRLASLDGLTGLANRRHLDRFLEQETRRCGRSRLPLSVILADADRFKGYNDHFGHLAGDDCLKAIARTLQAAVGQPSDLAARYGGEEFCLVLPERPRADALAIAEALRAAVQALAIAQVPGAVPPVVTLSLGVATAIPGADDAPGLLLKRADEALYRAKQAGRNRVGEEEAAAARVA